MRCPWCRAEPDEDGSARFLYHNGKWSASCPYCRGTGEYEAWMKHPEYARQRADPALTKFAVTFP
jgi:hypothetical protein